MRSMQRRCGEEIMTEFDAILLIGWFSLVGFEIGRLWRER
jgi:hypothetical protein